MPDTPTPGQAAYEAYSANIANPYYYAWEKLGPYEQRAWEAAAQAVLVETLAHWRAREAAVLGVLVQPPCIHAVHDLRFPTLLCGAVGRPGDYMRYTSTPGRVTCVACQAVLVTKGAP